MAIGPRFLRCLLCGLLACWAAWFVVLQLRLSRRETPQQLAASVESLAASPPAADPPRRTLSPPPPPPPPPPLPLGCPRDCHALPQTELPGDVVQWGSDHKEATAAACCAACKSKQGCNSWVFCSDARACGARLGECWLKERAAPFEDLDVLSGRSALWTSGALGEAPPPPSPLSAAAAEAAPFDLALLTIEGVVRLRLRKQAPSAAKYVADVLAEGRGGGGTGTGGASVKAPAVVASRPVRDGLRFYRAEPVPERWGSLDWPDNYLGGRWGPPYSLLQGSLRPTGTRVRPASPDSSQGAKPVIRRGMVAWAGGGGGPDFFVALAQHPEWGNGHTVWAEVLPGDMAVIDAIMRRPLRVANWGSINATELITPVPFALLNPEEARAVIRG